MALYSHTTLDDARMALSSQLGDTSFWTYEELDLYIKEGIRYWNSLTHRFKKRENIVLTPGQHFYDLYNESININTTLLDQDLLVEIQYHLLESIDADSWSGTAQFTLESIQSSMQGVLDEFYMEVIPRLNVQTVAGAGMLDFHNLSSISPTTPVIDIHRAAWLDSNGQYSVLWRADEDQMRSYVHGWEGTPANRPSAYSIWKSQPLEVRLMPRSNQPGSVQYIFQKSAPILNLSVGVNLGIPDDLAWVVKYGVLADLLDQEGMATDTTRAAYCRKRYEDGLEIAKAYPSVLGAELNGISTQIGRLRDMDAYSDWQNEPSGTPDRVFFVGYNLFGVAPSPNVAPHSILFDLVQPAPVPMVDGDNIQLDKYELEAVIAYAQHIASFKQGGREFLDTSGQMADVAQSAIAKNNKLLKQTWAKTSQDAKTYDEQLVRPLGNRS